ncbi:hypothetical protein ACS0TY_016359 [Phlomoides rotata]
MVLENEIMEVKSTGLGDYHSIPIGKICYRAGSGIPKGGRFASMPCGVCPVIGLCAPDGLISPRDRFAQWTGQETHDFLTIRGELDPIFMGTRRNKPLWEIVSTRMREIGYYRNPQQCKSKWKNLITRYKGYCETIEVGEMRQDTFPFYNDLRMIFNARMQRMMWLEAEGGGGASSSRQAPVQISSDDEEAVGQKRIDRDGREKKKKRTESTGGGRETSSGKNIVDGIKDVMEEYMKQQMDLEMQWMKAYEEREERKRVREREWRQTVEELEIERLMMMRRWREREEQRKVREEARAERRDALFSALLDKIRRGG